MHALTAKEASESLSKLVREKSWYVTIGVQDAPTRMPPSSTLIVYVTKKHADQDHLPSEWMGYHVKVVVSGRVVPA